MNIYDSLLQRWSSTMTSQEQSLLQGLSDRYNARVLYARGQGEDPDQDCAGFVRIARVFDSEPVALFGQDTPALAYSRMTITKAVRDASGALVPGDTIFEARMSDRALTLLVMESNQGSTQATLTGERLGDFVLPPYVAPSTRPADEAFHQERTQAFEAMRSALSGMRDVLNQGASAKHRKDAAALLANLARKVHNHGGVDYMLEQRLDSMAKRRVELVSEVAHAALHADHLVRASQQPRLAPPVSNTPDFAQARHSHPVLDASMDPYNPDERALVLRLLEQERDDALSTGGDRETFGGDTLSTWPAGQRLGGLQDAAKKRIEALSVVARNAIHKDKGIDPRCFSMGLIWVSGWPGFLHCSLPSTSGRYCNLRFESAWVRHRHADASIESSHIPMLEILLAPDDLMMALRGHPTGAMTPCTFRRVANVDVASHKRDRTGGTGDAGKRAENRVKESAAYAQVESAMEAVNTLLATTAANKAWKAEMDAAMATLTDALEAYLPVLDSEGFDQGLGDIADVMRTIVRQDLDDIRAVLPAPLMDRLMLR